VQFVRIDGQTMTDHIRDQKLLEGPLPDLLHRVDDLLTINVQVATEFIGKMTEERRPDYPVEALRQLARNAVMHRTYEGTHAPVRVYWFVDRVEIQNPGGPFGLVNRDNFGQPGVTDYRNPQLAEAMRVLGFVQRFGAGIPIARKELQQNGNPPPEFQVDATHVLVTLRPRALKPAAT
ncbi:MAG TPA: ATP-binding protein, partial [Phycisphaerae bacterium]|jgi:ATP-dependent DNA helicase RecG